MDKDGFAVSYKLFHFLHFYGKGTYMAKQVCRFYRDASDTEEKNRRDLFPEDVAFLLCRVRGGRNK